MSHFARRAEHNPLLRAELPGHCLKAHRMCATDVWPASKAIHAQYGPWQNPLAVSSFQFKCHSILKIWTENGHKIHKIRPPSFCFMSQQTPPPGELSSFSQLRHLGTTRTRLLHVLGLHPENKQLALHLHQIRDLLHAQPLPRKSHGL